MVPVTEAHPLKITSPMDNAVVANRLMVLPLKGQIADRAKKGQATCDEVCSLLAQLDIPHLGDKRQLG